MNDYILALFVKLADLCCDDRPAVRKSAGQTLFGTINVHSASIDVNFWHTVVWTVLFTLLTEVTKSYCKVSPSHSAQVNQMAIMFSQVIQVLSVFQYFSLHI